MTKEAKNFIPSRWEKNTHFFYVSFFYVANNVDGENKKQQGNESMEINKKQSDLVFWLIESRKDMRWKRFLREKLLTGSRGNDTILSSQMQFSFLDTF